MTWYAVRSVYEHARDRDGVGEFAERLVLLQTDEPDRLLELAQEEADGYLQLNPQFVRLGTFVAFRLRDEPTNFAEVWCMLFDSKASGPDFYRHRYQDGSG